jgi:prepilin-type N-terminal cleavage/methylation domain-containing protein
VRVVAAKEAKRIMKTTQPQSRPGFTLTEILIALALISFLLVGISRIFTMTSSTISIGQSKSRALRIHKAIAQTMSNDVIGYSSKGDIANSDENSGMMPLVVPEGSTGGAPFLMINNFRISAFDSDADRKAGPYSPPDVINLNFATHSDQVRRVSDGSGGETTVPIFEYGHRNFRCDTIGFFNQGLIQSQTPPVTQAGQPVRYQGELKSKSAFIFYGHPRIFTGDISKQNDVDAYGAPGAYVIRQGTTSVFKPNANQRFANQFTLARIQMLLVEPEAVGPPPALINPAGYTYKTVTTESGEYLPFVRRNWDSPAETGGTTLAPLEFDSRVFQYDPSRGQNVQLLYTGAPDFDEAFTGGIGPMTMRMGRTDILGVGAAELRARAQFLDAQVPPDWRVNLPNDWLERMLCNPFMPRASDSSNSLFSARVMAQRQQAIADGVSQFIVEYAGDFVTQAANGTLSARVPDGVIDFVEIAPDLHATRWYGLPRDVDGNQVISGTDPNVMRRSPDVIPLRDFAGGAFPFEAVAFSAQADYLQNIPANVNEPGGTTGSPNNSSYRCVWGPREFENPTVDALGIERYQVPTMIRFIVDVVDGKKDNLAPVTQEYVFPVKVKSN